VVAAKAQPPSDAVKQIHYLAAALEPLRVTEAATRLADQALNAGWTSSTISATCSSSWTLVRPASCTSGLPVREGPARANA
jgi:hypothetical protein